MRVAIFHELDFGGARRTVQELGKRLNKIIDVDLYYVDNQQEENVQKNYKNVFFYSFYPRIWKGNDWKSKLYKDSLELIRLYNLHRKIANDIQLKKYDYVFVHPSKYTQSPFLLRFISNAIYYCQEPLRIVYDPSVSSISDIKFPKNIYEYLNRKIRKWIDLINLKNTFLILANSNFSKELIIKSYNKKATVCYLGVDTDIFKPYNLSKAIDVLYIGNADENLDFLKEQLEICKSKIKLHVMLRKSGKPRIGDKELVKLYNQSKVLVALNHNEPFGLIPLEAMSCGTPVIAADEGGYRESVVNNKTGYLISKSDDSLCRKIKEIIDNDKLRNDMAKYARENVLNNWSWDRSIRCFLDIIKYEK
jgi:glycosyltransferase involved in cell wall biosynthesis